MVIDLARKPLDNGLRILDLNSNPMTVTALANRISCAAPAKRIQDEIPWKRAHLDNSLQNLRAYCVGRPLVRFKLSVTYGGMSVHTSFRLTPFGFIACRWPP